MALLIGVLTACGARTDRGAAGTESPHLGDNPALTSTAATQLSTEQAATSRTATPWAAPSATVLPMASSTPATADSAFDPALAYKFVAEQVSFGPRVPGSPAHARAIEWIRDQLQRAGWSVELQEFTYRNVKLTNVIGRSPGQSRPWIILGAHFDTRPVADQDPGDPAQPVTGANDGASGVAVLLALAHALPPDSMPCEIWLAFFDAEDSGGINDWEWFVGSSYMAESLAGDPNAVVIADMVGDADLQLYQERNSDPEITASIWETAADLGQEGFIPEPKHSILDDHIPFIRRGIPAVDIIDFDYPHWHTTQDTLDKVSAESLNQVGETLRTWLIGQCRLSD